MHVSQNSRLRSFSLSLSQPLNKNKTKKKTINYTKQSYFSFSKKRWYLSTFKETTFSKKYQYQKQKKNFWKYFFGKILFLTEKLNCFYLIRSTSISTEKRCFDNKKNSSYNHWIIYWSLSKQYFCYYNTIQYVYGHFEAILCPWNLMDLNFL